MFETMGLFKTKFFETFGNFQTKFAPQGQVKNMMQFFTKTISTYISKTLLAIQMSNSKS